MSALNHALASGRKLRLTTTYRGHTVGLMPAKKIAISLSGEALALVDRLAAQEGLSRSAWFERAVLRAKRRAGVARAVSMAQRLGIPTATDAELAKLRKELSKSA